ncbi:cell division ATP-binding protein FtsE [Candidatus Woesebacteria bacterium RIFCSPHIGHO2_01_FULL_39_32]|uniref:Cell division ATP-binding protein FtsE n=2 Tax=Candidatus Woeseibacteriota TaxID=1752722 RepID=A0A0G0PRB4_9BACT|nr:MAG: Cell division ATP-binding protein FtsE [Candidatus Woesebacteria bacterium GW2011_GWA1_39_8]OGM25251.1 MAG: cell division ATP-binding protein FtsE [Candidatus Woesebacteria bacterium RIFCSPHIGHO2_01_FULL_39_32]OGM37751.1 MAG: cell division ATP-binding protein FtsE [Candidatus Woesebacteria bacterium RIFCSPHIGHO2_12_FULL_38_11]OGM64782.1 MAG: cell division ATP-binding protein FtsE [Candidatus Woesebacteria bacterium RIFCSPLOWO2_01_FULL_39_25]
MLELINVTKTFGDIAALSDISFKVDDGEFVFISGPSGAGKTTLLRLLLREIKPNQGEIILDGKNIAKLSSKEVPRLRQHIGTIFQDFKVIPERTVAENVEVALAVIGLPKNEWPARTEHVLRLVGLSDRANLFPSQLSGGELQRVSMARALVVNPKIILADEPTGNLDWETADKIMDLFEKINQEGKTIIMATHHKLIINKLKKRVIELKDGKVISRGASLPQKKEKKVDESEKEM